MNLDRLVTSYLGDFFPFAAMMLWAAIMASGVQCYSWYLDRHETPKTKKSRSKKREHSIAVHKPA